MRRFAGFAALLAFTAMAAAAPPVYDVVLLTNGDRITGTIKNMESGALNIKTAYYEGNIAVDWRQVASVTAVERFQVLLANGARLTGRIEKLQPPAPASANFEIYQANGSVRVAARAVVWIHPNKATFLRQLTGSVGAGAGYTSGNNQRSLDTNARAGYATPGWRAGGSYIGTFNGQPGSRDINTQNVSVESSFFLRSRSYLIAYAAGLHSLQQQVDLLTTYGGGYGYYFFRRANAYWNVFAGAAYLRERFSTAGHPLEQAGAGLFGTEFDLVRFNVGEARSQLMLLPAANHGGRLLLTDSNAISISLPNNFNFTFSFWDNFNSRPPDGSRRNELGLSTTIGYSF